MQIILYLYLLHLLYNLCYATNVAQKYCYYPTCANMQYVFAKLQYIVSKTHLYTYDSIETHRQHTASGIVSIALPLSYHSCSYTTYTRSSHSEDDCYPSCGSCSYTTYTRSSHSPAVIHYTRSIAD